VCEVQAGAPLIARQSLKSSNRPTSLSSDIEVPIMVRSIFFSLGLFIALWGGAFLVVDKMVLNTDSDPTAQGGFRGLFGGAAQTKKRVIDPPDWAAFSLMSLGTVTMLYAVALPKKKQE
jgi:hypothetical protein